MTFMARFGFSIAELRQLYVDEFSEFFQCLTEVLEGEGVLKKGASKAAVGKKDDVQSLKSQLKMMRKK